MRKNIGARTLHKMNEGKMRLALTAMIADCTRMIEATKQPKLRKGREHLREFYINLLNQIGTGETSHLYVAKKQGTRLLKVYCLGCGYTLRTTMHWLMQAVPTCPQDAQECPRAGETMEVQTMSEKALQEELEKEMGDAAAEPEEAAAPDAPKSEPTTDYLSPEENASNDAWLKGKK